ncbi:unnamed protein product [Closterium sp. Naga37s-1]|nr:unnamed protein product [Closterium sp. Naga37s-1]
MARLSPHNCCSQPSPHHPRTTTPRPCSGCSSLSPLPHALAQAVIPCHHYPTLLLRLFFLFVVAPHFHALGQAERNQPAAPAVKTPAVAKTTKLAPGAKVYPGRAAPKTPAAPAVGNPALGKKPVGRNLGSVPEPPVPAAGAPGAGKKSGKGSPGSVPKPPVSAAGMPGVPTKLGEGKDSSGATPKLPTAPAAGTPRGGRGAIRRPGRGHAGSSGEAERR